MSENAQDELRKRGVLGPYKIRRELGHGGMGIVYLAHQEGLDRLVALKVVLPHLAVSADLMARFRREYRTHAKLEHPNIVRFYDAGEIDGFHYCAMEYLEATPLDEVIKRRDTTQDFQLANRVAEGMSAALDYLHRQEILHRDIKPGNVMIERGTDRVVVMDFGLVKPKDVTQLTRVGKTVGSPRYMAPETLSGETSDHRTDLYQMGVTLYQVATGKVPFDGVDLTSLASAILYGRLAPPREVCPLVPLAMQNLILNLLMRNPDDRYPDAEAVLADVKRLKSGLSVRRIALLPDEDSSSPEVGALSGADRSFPSFSTSIAQVSQSHSQSAAGTAGYSALRSSSVHSQPPSRVPPLLPFLVAGALLSFVPFFLLRTGTSYEAEQVRAVAGVRAAELQWIGTPEYPAKVVVRPAGDPDPDLARIFVGGAPGPEGSHSVQLEPLDPDKEYEARIAFPNGSLSLPYPLPTVVGGEPRLVTRLEYGEDKLLLVLESTPPIRGSLRYRAGDAWREVSLGNEYRSRHELELPLPPDRGAWNDATLALQAVGARFSHPLDSIRGRSLRREALSRRLMALDMAEVIQALEERGPEGWTRDQIFDLLAVPDFVGVLQELEAGDKLDGENAADWKLVEAIQRLQSIDAWFGTKKQTAVMNFPAALRGVTRFRRPTSVPPGGEDVIVRQLDGITSFVPQGGSKRGQQLLEFYAGSTGVKRQHEASGILTVSRPPEPGGRMGVAVLVRNLAHEYAFRVSFEGGRSILLGNRPETYVGSYWGQLQEKARGLEYVFSRIREHQQWLYAEVPADLLRAGRNRLTITAEIHAGLAPNHFVEAYALRVWPTAPPFPSGPESKKKSE